MKPLFVLPLVVLSLLLAVWSGWIRIGWNFPVTQSVARHGGLMIGSFLSTVILLEKGLGRVFFATGHP
jgi:hypothetical protein